MNDTQAEKVLLAVQELAIVVRDEGPHDVLVAARAVLATAGGDAVAALVVAAAAIPVDSPLETWWQQESPTLRPCGTEAAYRRHRYRKEQPCQLCKSAHAEVAKGRVA